MDIQFKGQTAYSKKYRQILVLAENIYRYKSNVRLKSGGMLCYQNSMFFEKPLIFLPVKAAWRQ